MRNGIATGPTAFATDQLAIDISLHTSNKMSDEWVVPYFMLYITKKTAAIMGENKFNDRTAVS